MTVVGSRGSRLRRRRGSRLIRPKECGRKGHPPPAVLGSVRLGVVKIQRGGDTSRPKGRQGDHPG